MNGIPDYNNFQGKRADKYSFSFNKKGANKVAPFHVIRSHHQKDHRQAYSLVNP